MQISEPAWINSSYMMPDMAIITGCNLESGDDHPIHITPSIRCLMLFIT